VEDASPEQKSQLLGAVYNHTYAIVGTWNSWKISEMTQSSTDPNLWSGKFKIRSGGEEEFQFVRDGDWQQRVYPAENCPCDFATPVLGPDGGGAGYNWKVHGGAGETVEVQLSLAGGELKVSWQCRTQGNLMWQSAPEEERRKYYLTGSFNGWGTMEEMRPSTDGTYKGTLAVSDDCMEEFQIVVGGNRNQVLHPETPQELPGHGMLCGPEAAGKELSWAVMGPPGQMMEIVLDLHAADRRTRVSSRPYTGEGDRAIRVVERGVGKPRRSAAVGVIEGSGRNDSRGVKWSEASRPGKEEINNLFYQQGLPGVSGR